MHFPLQDGGTISYEREKYTPKTGETVPCFGDPPAVGPTNWKSRET